MPGAKVVILGAGAMGGFYASRFFDDEPGGVFLLAGGDRGRRLSREGLIVNERRYPIPVLRPETTGPPADLVLVALKHHHLQSALPELKACVGPDTTIVSVMNGIDSEETIAGVCGREKVLYAVAVGIDALRQENRIRCTQQGKLYFGEAQNTSGSERVRRVRALFDRAGIDYEIPPDMIRMLWWKFMINVGINQASAVLRASFAAFQRSRAARELMVAAMEEVMALSKSVGIDLRRGDIDEWVRVLHGIAPHHKTSMLQDVEAGRRTEVDMFAGRVVELGQAHDVPTPVNQMFFKIIRAMESIAETAAG